MITVFKHYPLPVKLLLTASFTLTLGRAITLPFLVIYLAATFGLNIGAIGSLIGGALICGSVLSVYGGYLSDHLSSYRLVLAYTGLFISGFAGMCVTEHLGVFFGFLVTFNFAYSAMDVVVKAALGRLLTSGEQGRAFSIRYTLINIAYALGPFLGAWLSKAYLKLPFMVSASLGLALLVAYALYGERRREDSARFQPPIGFLAVGRVLLNDRRLVFFTLGGLLSAVVFGQFTAYLSQYLVVTSSAEAAYPIISTLVAVNAVVVVALQYVIGRRVAADKLEAWLMAGLGLFLAGVLGFAFSSTPLHWALSMAVFTLGEIIVFPAEYMFIDRIAPDHLRGMYYGAQNLSSLGAALGPILCGWLLAVAPAPWIFVMLCAFIVVGGMLYRVGAKLAAPSAAG
ncbi:MFS transporter [Pseudomonas sp. RIT-PI-S]|uniref:MFS transporter n=1 Tax=Pseudomonas sp. RIT-PI-S TaxID=3035295 RepID=UPI0021D9BA90|nr:MFS transporter [Pseudomonas sp. RIT-PI-S]